MWSIIQRCCKPSAMWMWGGITGLGHGPGSFQECAQGAHRSELDGINRAADRPPSPWHAKHHHAPEGIKLGELPAYRKEQSRKVATKTTELE
jgi:hypothetical protein